MTLSRSNLILIGMPGAGKSTVGVILAKLTSRDFVDTDVLIQTLQGRTLQDIVDTDGYAALRKIEEDVLCDLSVRNCVIATGGSAVYSDSAMSHLTSEGLVVFLDVDVPTLASRIHDYSTRGLAKSPDQNFDDMFRERSALYMRYSDITITCAGLTHEEVCARILERVKKIS
jgi:shikimate kinase